VRGCLTCVPSKGLTEFPFPPKIIADDLVLREATFFTDNVVSEGKSQSLNTFALVNFGINFRHIS